MRACAGKKVHPGDDQSEEPKDEFLPDFVLVWNENSKDQNNEISVQKRNIFEYYLEEEGLHLEWGNSEISPHLHVTKIWAPLEVLKTYAEILQLRLPIKELPNYHSPHLDLISQRNSLDSLKKLTMEKLNAGWFWKRVEWYKHISALDEKLFPKRHKKFTHVYQREKDFLFEINESNMHDFFTLSTRARIMEHILRKTPFQAKDEKDDLYAYGYEQLIKEKVYETGYALHDGNLNEEGSVRKLLYDNWGKYSKCWKSQPLNAIRDYFGEDFALYFAWLEFYTKMLSFAAILGIACVLYGIVSLLFDDYLKDICNESLNIIMCPLCDTSCGYWKLSDKCQDSRMSHFFDNDSTVVFSFLMTVWSAVFLGFWKRHVASISYRWDLSSFDSKMDITPRPEYVAELKKFHQLSQKSQQNIPSSKEDEEASYKVRKRRLQQSQLVIPFWTRTLPFTILSYSTCLFLIAIAFAAICGIILYRVWLSWHLSMKYPTRHFLWKKLMVSGTSAILNAFMIIIFGQIYKKWAIKLTEMEYHRTQSEFEASLSVKSFALQAINNYCTISYIAFFKGSFAGSPAKYHRLFGKVRQDECGESCMQDLSIQLGTVVIVGQMSSIFKEMLIPWLMRKIKYLSRVKDAVKSKKIKKFLFGKKEKDQWLRDYDLLECNHRFLHDGYLDMVMQFGFIALFVSAFALAPLIVLLANILKIRVHARKLIKHHRRPVGHRVNDIGVWYNIVDGIVKVAMFSNALIIGVSSNFIPKLMYRFSDFGAHDENRPYSGLKGYLNISLTAFATKDLDAKPHDHALLSNNITTDVCYHPTRRYGYDAPEKNRYGYLVDHYIVWFGRAVFIILYENAVALISLVIYWLVPSMPTKLRLKIRNEEGLVNEIIERTELEQAKANKLLEVKHSRVLAKPTPTVNHIEDPHEHVPAHVKKRHD